MYEIYIAPGDTARERSSEILIWNCRVCGWVDGRGDERLSQDVAGSGRTCVRRREGSDLTALTCDSRAWGGRWCGAPAQDGHPSRREIPAGLAAAVRSDAVAVALTFSAASRGVYCARC